MTIDLHIHSTVSDGTMSPEELIEFAKKKGLKAVAITDHDTFDGVAPAMKVGSQLGVEVISGIELSVHFGDFNVHLLGYLFDHCDSGFHNAVSKLQNGRKQRNVKIIEKLSEVGFHTSIEELKRYGGIGQVGRPHIAKLMIAKGWAHNMDDAFERFLGQNGVAYVSRFSYSVKEACEYIHRAGGVSILAHPYNLCNNFDGKFDISPLRKIVEDGIDGVEAFYPTHSKKYIKTLIAFAEENSLIVTGGSDYHGTIRPGTTLAGGKNVSVPYGALLAMKQYRDRKLTNS